MMFVQFSHLIWDFSAFFVTVLLKVSTITDAVPLPDLCNLKGFTIDGVDISTLDIPRLLFEAADSPKKSTADKIKAVGDEVVEKIHEFYGLLAETREIQEDEAIEDVAADDTDYLVTRDVDPVREAIANEARLSATKAAAFDGSKSGSDKTTLERFESEPEQAVSAELESEQTASVESAFEKLESDKPETEGESADAAVPSESAKVASAPKQNVGDKIKQTTRELAQKIDQLVKNSLRNPDGELKIKAMGNKIKRHSDRFKGTLQQFYDEKIKRAAKIDPETGLPFPAKEKKSIGQRVKEMIKNPINKFLNFKLQLTVDVKPLNG